MSLSGIINTAEARSYLKEKIHNPGIDPEPETLVPPRAESPPRVGTAFDYALRAGLEARFEAVTRRPIAEVGLSMLRILNRGKQKKGDLGNVEERVERATRLLTELGTGSELPVATASACYYLAGMDVVYRAGQTDQVGREATEHEVHELQDLYEIVPWKEFKPEKRLYLNPTFGEASSAVGGADADVVIDNTIVELKTIKRQRPRIRMFRQLAGYALFAQRYGLNREGIGITVNHVAIYFSRAGVLRRWRLSEVIEEGAEDEVIDYFINFYESPGLEIEWVDEESSNHKHG